MILEEYRDLKKNIIIAIIKSILNHKILNINKSSQLKEESYHNNNILVLLDKIEYIHYPNFNSITKTLVLPNNILTDDVIVYLSPVTANHLYLDNNHYIYDTSINNTKILWYMLFFIKKGKKQVYFYFYYTIILKIIKNFMLLLSSLLIIAVLFYIVFELIVNFLLYPLKIIKRFIAKLVNHQSILDSDFSQSYNLDVKALFNILNYNTFKQNMLISNRRHNLFPNNEKGRLQDIVFNKNLINYKDENSNSIINFDSIHLFKNKETLKLEQLLKFLSKIIVIKSSNENSFNDKSILFEKFLNYLDDLNEKEYYRQCLFIISYSKFQEKKYLESIDFSYKLLYSIEKEEKIYNKKHENLDNKLITYYSKFYNKYNNDFKILYFNNKNYEINNLDEDEQNLYNSFYCIKINKQKTLYFLGLLYFQEYKKHKFNKDNNLLEKSINYLTSSLEINESLIVNPIKVVFTYVLISKCYLKLKKYVLCSVNIKEAITKFCEINNKIIENKIYVDLNPKVIYLIINIMFENIYYLIFKLNLLTGKYKLSAIILNEILNKSYFLKFKRKKNILLYLSNLLYNDVNINNKNKVTTKFKKNSMHNNIYLDLEEQSKNYKIKKNAIDNSFELTFNKNTNSKQKNITHSYVLNSNNILSNLNNIVNNKNTDSFYNKDVINNFGLIYDNCYNNLSDNLNKTVLENDLNLENNISSILNKAADPFNYKIASDNNSLNNNLINYLLKQSKCLLGQLNLNKLNNRMDNLNKQVFIIASGSLINNETFIFELKDMLKKTLKNNFTMSDYVGYFSFHNGNIFNFIELTNRDNALKLFDDSKLFFKYVNHNTNNKDYNNLISKKNLFYDINILKNKKKVCLDEDNNAILSKISYNNNIKNFSLDSSETDKDFSSYSSISDSDSRNYYLNDNNDMKYSIYNSLKLAINSMKERNYDQYICLFINSNEFNFNNMEEARETLKMSLHHKISIYVFVFNEDINLGTVNKILKYLSNFIESYVILVKNFKVIEESIKNFCYLEKNINEDFIISSINNNHQYVFGGFQNFII